MNYFEYKPQATERKGGGRHQEMCRVAESCLHAGRDCDSVTCAVSPLSHIPGRLEEAGVVVLLQAVLSLCDEGTRALQTLSAVRNLLSQLPQLHHLHPHTRTLESIRIVI